MAGEPMYRHAEEVDGSIRAAPRLVPTILEVLGPVQSVVDVGGGTGAWLREFLHAGVEPRLLIDSPSVRPFLLVEAAGFQPCDLSQEFPILPRMELAMCLECAEHLPATQAAQLVASLTKVADRVVFSAAIPLQGGKGHINPQPANYWREISARYRFACCDLLRPRILHDEAVPFWYRQNLFLYVNQKMSEKVRAQDFLPKEFHLIHQEVLERYLDPPGLRTILRNFFPALWRWLYSFRSQITTSGNDADINPGATNRSPVAAWPTESVSE